MAHLCSNFLQPNARGVGRENGVWRRARFEILKELTFDVELLDNCFNDDLRLADALTIEIDAQPLARSISLSGSTQALAK